MTEQQMGLSTDLFLDHYTGDISLLEPELQAMVIDGIATAIISELPNMRPEAGAAEVLTAKAKKHDLFMITGKPLAARDVTDVWLQEFMPGVFKDVLYTDRFNPGITPSKRQLCQSLGITALVDDYPRQGLPAGVRHLIYGQYYWTPTPAELGPGEVLTADWQAVAKHL